MDKFKLKEDQYVIADLKTQMLQTYHNTLNAALEVITSDQYIAHCVVDNLQHTHTVVGRYNFLGELAVTRSDLG